MALTPFITQDRAPGDLRDAALELMYLDASLNAKIPTQMRFPMIQLQRLANSYYSNKLEGSRASPADLLCIKNNAADAEVAPDVLEIKHHTEAQFRLAMDPIDAAAICNRESIARIHRELFSGLPEKHLRLRAGGCGELASLVPGEYRTRGVKVGHHIPPHADKIGTYLTWFENAYRLNRLHGMAPLLAAAGAHHRLLWLHPFVDGNGRMGRLFTDEYLRRGLEGYGLWSMSRGFCHAADAYYAALRAADHVRKGVLDGRGDLSDSGLLQFTGYFITTALEQVRFVSALLEPRTLNGRINQYFHMRLHCAVPSANGTALPILRIEALHLYRRLLESGPMQHSEIQARLGLSESSTRDLLVQMASERLITLDEGKQVSLRLSEHSVITVFPDLF